MSSPQSLQLYQLDTMDSPPDIMTDSGYMSAEGEENVNDSSSVFKPVARLNKEWQSLSPQGTFPAEMSVPYETVTDIAVEILIAAKKEFPRLYQTTAFGLTGLATIDMLSKLNPNNDSPVDLIFFDTLHHFQETLALVEQVHKRYPHLKIHTYTPANASTPAEFARVYGDRLWDSNEDQYDYVAKVEPAQRAYRELQAQAVLTGRRRTQGGSRGDLPVIEVDEAGLIKINPLIDWNFKQVEQYIQENHVPYNVLLDRGYKSVGDWHSTQPVAAGEDERAGRWKGQQKTECGIHNPRSRYAQLLKEREVKKQEEQLQQAMDRKMSTPSAVMASS